MTTIRKVEFDGPDWVVLPDNELRIKLWEKRTLVIKPTLQEDNSYRVEVETNQTSLTIKAFGEIDGVSLEGERKQYPSEEDGKKVYKVITKDNPKVFYVKGSGSVLLELSTKTQEGSVTLGFGPAPEGSEPAITCLCRGAEKVDGKVILPLRKEIVIQLGVKDYRGEGSIEVKGDDGLVVKQPEKLMFWKEVPKEDSKHKITFKGNTAECRLYVSGEAAKKILANNSREVINLTVRVKESTLQLIIGRHIDVPAYQTRVTYNDEKEPILLTGTRIKLNVAHTGFVRVNVTAEVLRNSGSKAGWKPDIGFTSSTEYRLIEPIYTKTKFYPEALDTYEKVVTEDKIDTLEHSRYGVGWFDNPEQTISNLYSKEGDPHSEEFIIRVNPIDELKKENTQPLLLKMHVLVETRPLIAWTSTFVSVEAAKLFLNKLQEFLKEERVPFEGLMKLFKTPFNKLALEVEEKPSQSKDIINAALREIDPIDAIEPLIDEHKFYVALPLHQNVGLSSLKTWAEGGAGAVKDIIGLVYLPGEIEAPSNPSLSDDAQSVIDSLERHGKDIPTGGKAELWWEKEEARAWNKLYSFLMDKARQGNYANIITDHDREFNRVALRIVLHLGLDEEKRKQRMDKSPIEFVEKLGIPLELQIIKKVNQLDASRKSCRNLLQQLDEREFINAAIVLVRALG